MLRTPVSALLLSYLLSCTTGCGDSRPSVIMYTGKLEEPGPVMSSGGGRSDKAKQEPPKEGKEAGEPKAPDKDQP